MAKGMISSKGRGNANLKPQPVYQGSKSTNKDQSKVARRPAGGRDSQSKKRIAY